MNIICKSSALAVCAGLLFVRMLKAVFFQTSKPSVQPAALLVFVLISHQGAAS